MSVHLEVVLVLAQDRCMVAMIVPREWKSFWAHLIIIVANAGKEEARFDPFRDSVNLVAR